MLRNSYEPKVYRLLRPDISPYRRLFRLLHGHFSGVLSEEARNTMLLLPHFHSQKYCGLLLWKSIATPFLFHVYMQLYDSGNYFTKAKWKVQLVQSLAELNTLPEHLCTFRM